METCRPQQSIHVDQFFVSRLSTKKSKAKRKKKGWCEKKKMIIQRKNVYKSNACSSIEKEETIVCFQMLRTGK